MKKTRCDYTHEIIEYNGINVLCIVDLDLGNRSVTNNIESIVEELKLHYSKEVFPSKIIYRDSSHRWDGWDDKRQCFVYLNTPDKKEALKIIIAK